VHRANGWGCDGRNQEHGLGCGRGFGDCDELERYRCIESCDYDLCPDCMSTLVGFEEVRGSVCVALPCLAMIIFGPTSRSFRRKTLVLLNELCLEPKI
jgi:hypothetical protein